MFLFERRCYGALEVRYTLGLHPLRNGFGRGVGHHERNKTWLNLKINLQEVCADALDCDAVLTSFFNDFLVYRQSDSVLLCHPFGRAVITAEVEAVFCGSKTSRNEGGVYRKLTTIYCCTEALRPSLDSTIRI